MSIGINTECGNITLEFVEYAKGHPVDSIHEVYRLLNVAFPDGKSEVRLHTWENPEGKACTGIYEDGVEWGWHYRSEESRMLSEYLKQNRATISCADANKKYIEEHIEDVVTLDDAVAVARSLIRDHEYGYSVDDLVVEAEGFMREKCFSAVRVD